MTSVTEIPQTIEQPMVKLANITEMLPTVEQSIIETANEHVVTNSEFMSSISSLPIVTSALEQLAAIYKSTKESNKLVKVTLETAESGVRVAATTAQPIITQLEGPSK